MLGNSLRVPHEAVEENAQVSLRSVVMDPNDLVPVELLDQVFDFLVFGLDELFVERFPFHKSRRSFIEEFHYTGPDSVKLSDLGVEKSQVTVRHVHMGAHDQVPLAIGYALKGADRLGVTLGVSYPLPLQEPQNLEDISRDNVGPLLDPLLPPLRTPQLMQILLEEAIEGGGQRAPHLLDEYARVFEGYVNGSGSISYLPEGKDFRSSNVHFVQFV